MGCGHVPLYGTYHDLVDETVCIDWENSLHLNPFLDKTVDLNDTLPFDNRRFDTILLTDVLEHIAEPQRLVSEIARLLESNGKLIMGVPFFYWLHEVPHDYYRFTEHALRRFCDVNGLKVLQCEPYGGLPEVFVDLTLKAISHFPKTVATCMRIAYSPIVTVAKTGVCKRVSKLTQSTFPLGYILVAQK
jgi:SAM-dependent methyltransferase